jgi:Zn-dependent peptidase ImmA (M78 family)
MENRLVQIEELATALGLEVIPWPLPLPMQEVKVGQFIAVSANPSPAWRRWVIAHAIGLHLLHSGVNTIWLQARTLLADRLERQAEDFAWGLLVDEEEARRLGLREPWEIAEHFGVPEEIVRGRLDYLRGQNPAREVV